MRKFGTLLFLCFVVLNLNAQKTNTGISFLGSHLSLQLPAGMDTMPADKIMVKYQKKPDAKTSYYGNADYSFSAVVSEIANDITEPVMLQIKSQLLQQLGKQNFTENKVLTINGHKLIVVSYTTAVPGNKIFNRHVFVAAGNKLFAIAFNTTEADLVKRKAQIEKSIRSVTIK